MSQCAATAVRIHRAIMSSLLQSIAEAFNDVPYPGDDNLTVYDPAGRESDETWQLRSNIKSGKAVDQTLSEVDKGDAPGMFGLQTLGFVLLISASALIGMGALIVLVQELIAGD